MRLAEFYTNLQKQAEEAAPETQVQEEEQIDKVALATHVVSEMNEDEQIAFAKALGLVDDEPIVKENAEDGSESAETDDEVIKQAEDIFTAGRIFARGMMEEAQGER